MQQVAALPDVTCTKHAVNLLNKLERGGVEARGVQIDRAQNDVVIMAAVAEYQRRKQPRLFKDDGVGGIPYYGEIAR